MINLTNFSECLKDLMNEKKINTQTLVNQTGVSKNVINSYLRSVMLPTLQSAIKLADFFHCSIEYLLARTTANNTNANKPIPPFGERLRFVLEYFESNQNKLVKGTGISSSRTYGWLYENSTPSIDSLAKIADFYSTTIDFVIGRE